MSFYLKKCYDNIRHFAKENTSIDSEARVIDIGCGGKGNFWGFSPAAYLGLDNSEQVVRNNLNKKNGDYRVCNVSSDFNFKDDSADLIVSVSFFHHISDQDARGLIKQTKRVLKSSGKMIMVDGIFPDSRLNVLGALIRYFDRGRYVRDSAGFETLFKNEYYVEKKYAFTENIFAYAALLLRPNDD